MSRRITLVLAIMVAFTPEAAAQSVFIAPISDFAVGDVGPTRFEYITHFDEQESCATVTVTNRQERADFEVWFEYEAGVNALVGTVGGRHYAIVWRDGEPLAMEDAILSENIVSDTCDAIVEHGRFVEHGPLVQTYPTCVELRAAGWDVGISAEGGTYQDAWDQAERETYELNADMDRNSDGLLCNLE